MAERRMFAKTIIDSDAFLDMPQSTQLLYFHLSMRADDEGFINNAKSIMRNTGCKEDDIKLLIAKRFIIPFESGVIVIKHWKIHNYIQKDRFTPTKYIEEKSTLTLSENKSYTECTQDVYTLDTQVRLGKDSIGKDSIGESISGSDEPAPTPKIKKQKYGEYKNVLLTDEEHAKIIAEPNGIEAIEFLSAYIAEKPYKSKSHYLAIKRWVLNAVDERANKKGGEQKTKSVLDPLLKAAQREMERSNANK